MIDIDRLPQASKQSKAMCCSKMHLTRWRPLLPYGHSYRTSCAKLG